MGYTFQFHQFRDEIEVHVLERAGQYNLSWCLLQMNEKVTKPSLDNWQ